MRGFESSRARLFDIYGTISPFMPIVIRYKQKTFRHATTLKLANFGEFSLYKKGIAMEKKRRFIGFLYVLFSAVFWGIGGTVSQYLFQNENLSVEWLVSFRLLVSGAILLLIAKIKNPKFHLTRIFYHKPDALSLVIFSLFGMLSVQYTYMASIDLGNAAVATLLQYLSPVYVIIYLVLRKSSKQQISHGLAVLLALTGTFLLLTNGSLKQLSVPASAIIWGILSGIALAFYTLYPRELLKKWGALAVVGWGMLIAGTALACFYPPWHIDMSSWTIATGWFLFFVVIFGTMLAFWFYLESLAYLRPQETSVLGTVEPLAAILASVLWLQIPFGLWQMLGSCLILAMVILLAFSKP